ncbi:MAG: hypothetical protein AB1656_06120 [Candidatus Omnitrophota bacterium]
MKNSIHNKSRKKIFIVLALGLLLPLILQLHSYAVYYSCDARCFSYLCQNIPNNQWFQYVGNGLGDIYDGIYSSWYCRYCPATITNISGSTQSFCTTIPITNGVTCTRCNWISSAALVRVANYILNLAKDNCGLSGFEEKYMYTCNGNQITGSCYAPDNDSLGSCP